MSVRYMILKVILLGTLYPGILQLCNGGSSEQSAQSALPLQMLERVMQAP